MLSNNQIKKALEDYFHIGFEVKLQGQEYIINFKESNENFFYLRVINKDDIRLTIVAEPQKYGKQFVETINMSNKWKRTLFSNYWLNIGVKNITLKINEIPINQESFIEDKSNWNSFLLRYSISPFYENSEEKDSKIVDAIISVIAMVLTICDYSIDGLEEGEKTLTMSQKYERNPINRKLCLLNKGYTCSVCGFNFEKEYGEIGKEFIEVHHSLQVSKMGAGHIVDPIKELFPVCPNCHSMLHKKDPPFSIDELKEIIKKVQQ